MFGNNGGLLYFDLLLFLGRGDPEYLRVVLKVLKVLC